MSAPKRSRYFSPVYFLPNPTTYAKTGSGTARTAGSGGKETDRNKTGSGVVGASDSGSKVFMAASSTAMVYDAVTGRYAQRPWLPFIGPVDPATLGAPVSDDTPWFDTDASLFGLGLAAMPVTGYWVTTPHGSRNTAVTTLQRAHFMPLWVSERFTAVALAAEATVATAGAQLQVAVYGTAGPLPGDLIYDGGVLDVSAAAVQSTAAFSLVLTPGLYWLASLGLSVATTMRGIATGAAQAPLAQAGAGGATVNGMWRLDSQTALPLTAPGVPTLLGGSGPLVWLKAA